MNADGTNLNPLLFEPAAPSAPPALSLAQREAVDAAEVFELVRSIEDPEHPHSLEQLHVLCLEDIELNAARRTVTVEFTPTVPNCSSAALIGLMIAAKLQRCLHPALRPRVRVKAGTHELEEAINKQLADKERVAAAFENEDIARTIGGKLRRADRPVTLAMILE